jgi:Phage tail protein
MATLTSLNNYSFAWNNFIFGGSGSPYQITNADGITNLPNIRNQDDTQGFNDGMFSGRDFLGGRTIVLTILTLSGQPTLPVLTASANGSGVITYTTNIAHGFSTGQVVTITGIISTGNPTGTAGSGFNRNSQTITVTSTTSFTIPITLTDTYTSGGLITNTATFSAQSNFNLLKSALQPQQTGTTPLQFQLSTASNLQFFYARVRDAKTVITPEFTYGYITSQVTFFCPDPRAYDNTLQVATLAVGNPLGRTYNRTYNLTYGGGSTGITTTVNNTGNWTTYPIITLNGPITNPIFGNLTQSIFLTISGTFTNTDTVVIDLGQKTITYNGSPARNLLAAGSNWFSAPPGSNQFYMTGLGTIAGTTAASVTWRNAYI